MSEDTLKILGLLFLYDKLPGYIKDNFFRHDMYSWAGPIEASVESITSYSNGARLVSMLIAEAKVDYEKALLELISITKREGAKGG